jgi:hypothetical protein
MNTNNPLNLKVGDRVGYLAGEGYCLQEYSGKIVMFTDTAVFARVKWDNGEGDFHLPGPPCHLTGSSTVRTTDLTRRTCAIGSVQDVLNKEGPSLDWHDQ